MAQYSETSKYGSQEAAKSVDNFVQSIDFQRKPFERRWYDNNFFDDGFHFRYVSRQTGKIVDENGRNFNNVQRAIPKASRQIRGLANLIVNTEPHPVIYPKPISLSQYPPLQDPATGQMVPNPLYKEAIKASKEIAYAMGHWVEEEWRTLDLKEITTLMIILAAKHGVSYVEILPDIVQEKINAKVYDAFDIYLNGSLTNISDQPMIVKTTPTLVAKIKANPYFSEEQTYKLNPDNKYATSEVKQAYMMTRFGNLKADDTTATLMLKEAFIKETLDDWNWQQASKDSDTTGAMEGKSKGDDIMRQVFCAGGVYLRDKYVNLPDYPITSFTFEPGPLYQVPLIERFMSANKSLDTLVSRLEKYSNSMVTGIWKVRKGENFTINNDPTGVIAEYEGTPPEQGTIAPIPNFYFNLINILNEIIEEQGATTAALGRIPSGVRSGVAIESIKETEYANLKIATDQYKKTVTSITEKIINVASNYYITPRTVSLLVKNEPTFFDVVGQMGERARKKAKIEVPQGTLVIEPKMLFNIETESGLGYTTAGKREAAFKIAEYMRSLAEQGLIGSDAMKIVVEMLLDSFKFGSTGQFIVALDAGAGQIVDQDIDKIKVAVLEVLNDLGLADKSQRQEEQIESTKVGVAEVTSDLVDVQGDVQKQIREGGIS